MRDDELTQLLTKADDSAAGIAGRPDLATKVRSRHARRRVIRAGVTGSLLVILCIGSVVALFRIPKDEPQEIVQVPAIDSAALVAEIEQLDRQARLHQTIADRILAIERRSKVGSFSPIYSSDITIAASADTAAGILVYDSDRRYQSEQFRESAIEGYRLAIALFPQTSAAQVAMERLKNMDNY